MYPYHNRILQRIANGELVGYYEEQNYPKIGECIVLVFSTSPRLRPIRPHAFWRYEKILGEKNRYEIKRFC